MLLRSPPDVCSSHATMSWNSLSKANSVDLVHGKCGDGGGGGYNIVEGDGRGGYHIIGGGGKGRCNDIRGMATRTTQSAVRIPC